MSEFGWCILQATWSSESYYLEAAIPIAVRIFSARDLRTFIILIACSLSIPLVDSSKTIIRGWVTNSLPTVSLLIWPPLMPLISSISPLLVRLRSRPALELFSIKRRRNDAHQYFYDPGHQLFFLRSRYVFGKPEQGTCQQRFSNLTQPSALISIEAVLKLLLWIVVLDVAWLVTDFGNRLCVDLRSITKTSPPALPP